MHKNKNYEEESHWTRGLTKKNGRLEQRFVASIVPGVSTYARYYIMP